MDADLLWLIVAGALIGSELLTGTLVLGMLAVGALAASGLAFFGLGIVLQLLGFTLASGALLAFVRPPLRNALDRGDSTARIDPRVLTGSTALVVQRVDDDNGQVRIHGELWRARPYSGNAPLEIGQTVSVAAVEGATLLVYSTDLS